MSRVGKQPVEIPSGVTAKVADGVVSVQGSKGQLEHKVPAGVSVVQEEGSLSVVLEGSDRQARSNYGTTRSYLANMVKGVTEGWTKAVELHGVGYTAKLSGQVLTLTVGFSHDVNIDVPDIVNCKVQKTTIDFESCDKHAVGQLAAKVRAVCPPEPYLGKGIRYVGEHVRRKAGKTAK